MTHERILITGDRNWTNKTIIQRVLYSEVSLTTEYVIHGGAPGADTLGGEVATGFGLVVRVFQAQWKRYGRAAGPIRNQQMLDEGKPTLVLAFHNNLAKSKGTRDMVSRALKAKIPVYLNGKPLLSLPLQKK